jgi:hypothetical protein
VSRTRRCRGDRDLAHQVELLTLAVRELQRLARQESDKDTAVEILSRANGTGDEAYWRGWTDAFQSVTAAADGTPPPRPGPVRPLRVVPQSEGGR